MITALINTRAVFLIGLLDNRAVNLIDLEHSTHGVPGEGILAQRPQNPSEPTKKHLQYHTISFVC